MALKLLTNKAMLFNKTIIFLLKCINKLKLPILFVKKIKCSFKT